MNSFQNFGNITEDMAVTTLHDYLVEVGHETDDEGDFVDEKLYEKPENNLIAQILATEVAIFMMRRTAYLCGSAIDAIRETRRDLITRHKELTGSFYNDFNKDIDW